MKLTAILLLCAVSVSAKQPFPPGPYGGDSHVAASAGPFIATALQSSTTVVNVSNSSAPTAGQVLVATSSTSATFQTLNFSTGSILEFDSNPVGAGSASAVAVVPGLLGTDTILATSMRVPGANAVALIGWSAQGNDALTFQFSADPGGLAVVRVAVKR